MPKSTRLPENTPFDTSTSASLPRNVTCSVLRTSFDCGSAAKYCSACAMSDLLANARLRQSMVFFAAPVHVAKAWMPMSLDNDDNKDTIVQP